MKHIAGSGVKAGQWVTCPARIKCQLQGTIHASDNELYKVRLWKQEETNEGKYVAISKITREDYENFNALPEDEKNIYEEMFKDKVKESEKRAAKKAQTPRVATASELKAIAYLHKMSTPQTVKMNDGVAVQKVNYTDLEKAKAKENFAKTREVLKKWEEGTIQEDDIVEYIKHLKREKTWGNNTKLEDNASETIITGLIQPYRGASLIGAMHTLATSTLIFQITSYDKDVIKGVKKGSHFAEYARAEKAKKQAEAEKAEAERKLKEAELAALREEKEARKKKNIFKRIFS